jgi:2'-5' RNA ligase
LQKVLVSSLLAALSDRFATTGVHALGRLDVAQWYEAALVFGLPAELSSYVEGLRETLPIGVPAPAQIAPHLTVLYVGRWPAAALAAYVDALRTLEARVEVELDAFDIFVSGDVITNVHLACRKSPSIEALHRRAIATCRAAGWTPRTPYLGDAYRPHISIFDGLTIPHARRAELTSRAVAFAKVELDELRVIGKRVEGP